MARNLFANETEGRNLFADMESGKQSQPDEPGFFESIGNMITGSDRETRATQELSELESSIFGGDASGFLSTLPAKDALSLAATLSITSDPQERAKMLQSASPDFGIQYDEKGNIIAANNRTGQRVLLNAPGLSASDILPTSGRIAASIPLTATGTPLVAAASMGAKEGAITAAQEAAQASQGGDFDVGNVIADTALGGLSQYIPSAISRGNTRASQQADELTQEAIQAEAGRIANPASAEAQAAKSNELAGEIAKQSYKRKQNLSRSAGEVMPDKSVIEAAERLGVAEELTPGMISNNPIYKDIEGALRAKGGSELSVQGENAISKVAQKADDLITEFGGDIDKAALSQSVKEKVGNTINDLGAIESEAYDQVSKLTSPTQKVDMSDVYIKLQEEAENLGGAQFLEPFEKRLLKISESSPSYSLVDKERKKIGAALHKKQGAYKDMDSGRLKRMYGALTDAQGSSLSDEARNAWDAAKAVTVKRKGLEDSSQKLFGKNLSNSIAPKVGNALNRLSKADYKNFDEIMAAMPDSETRQKVLLTALNDVFTAGSRKENQLNIPGFVDWYGSLKRQPQLMKRVKDNLPDGAVKRLDDLYTLTNSIRDANSRVVKTGVAAETLSGLDKYEGMLERIYKGLPNIPVVDQGLSILKASGLAGKDPATVSADRLISSPEFKRMAIELAKSNFKATQSAKAAERALKKSGRYKKWFSLLPNEDKMRIIRGGLISYLGEQEE